MHESIKSKIKDLEDIKKLSEKYSDLELHDNRFIAKSWIYNCNLFKIEYCGCTEYYYLNLFFIDEETKKEIHIFKCWEFKIAKKNDCINNSINILEKLNIKESVILNIIKELYK